jgi:hypothetical protein
MQVLHKRGLPGGGLTNVMPVAASPSAGDSQGQGSQFAVGGEQNNRMNQKGMIPVSSSTSNFGGSDSFIGSIPTFDAFDDSLKGGFDVDFERDFGEWFNPAPEDDMTDPK